MDSRPLPHWTTDDAGRFTAAEQKASDACCPVCDAFRASTDATLDAMAPDLPPTYQIGWGILISLDPDSVPPGVRGRLACGSGTRADVEAVADALAERGDVELASELSRLLNPVPAEPDDALDALLADGSAWQREAEELREWQAGATGAATIAHPVRVGPHTEEAYCAHRSRYMSGSEPYRVGADVVSAAMLAATDALKAERDGALSALALAEARIARLESDLRVRDAQLAGMTARAVEASPVDEWPAAPEGCEWRDENEVRSLYLTCDGDLLIDVWESGGWNAWPRAVDGMDTLASGPESGPTGARLALDALRGRGVVS